MGLASRLPTALRRLCWLATSLGFLGLASCGRREPAPLETRQEQAGNSAPAPAALPEGVFDSLARTMPAGRPAVSFDEIARPSGIAFVHARGERTSMLPEDMGSGAAWGDYDNDGYPDLYLVNQIGTFRDLRRPPPDAPGNKLYRNNGDGMFADVTEAAGVGYRGFGMGAFWGDYDNDGCLDLYVTNYGRSVLYHNNCNGTFTDVTDHAGVANHRWATSAVWFDYDRDAWLDLYVCNYVEFDPHALPADQRSLQFGVNVPFTLNPASFAPQPNRLYRNNRDGTFTDVTAHAGVADARGRSLVVTAADFDMDGWPDLYVGNDISFNSFFRNLGNGRFADEGVSTNTAEYRGTMGIAVGDFDEDGDLDFFLTHWVAQANALYQNLYSELGPKSPNRLFFTDVADMLGVGSISVNDVSWGTASVDYDNDGLPDLIVIDGSTLEDPANRKLLQAQRPRLFWNRGPSGFFDLAGVSGAVMTRPWNGRGLAAADYDNDGDIDFLVTNNRGPALLLRNHGGNRRNWIKLRLVGVRSNRQGVGAKVRLAAGKRRFYAEMGTGGSYLSQNFNELHFGLGDQKIIQRIEILWPSGTRQACENLAANQLLEVVESGPRSGCRPLVLPPRGTSKSGR